MKTCPTCNRTFTDEWLAYCTEDGTTLIVDMPAELSREPAPPSSESAPPSSDPPPTVFIPPAADTSPTTPKPFDLPGSYNPPQPVTPAWQPPPPPPIRPGGVQKQGLAVASLILGIFSFTFGWCCSVGLLTAPVGIILGSISLVQIKNDPTTNTGKPLSIIGICLGGFYVVVWFLIFMIYGMAIFMGSLSP